MSTKRAKAVAADTAQNIKHKMTARDLIEALHPEHAWHTVTEYIFPTIAKCSCGEVLNVLPNTYLSTEQIKDALRNVPKKKLQT